ncbi:dihydrofolate reductase family protein [Natrialba asiatica]|uniref:Bifunctional deaminase-reductase domain-containing protein n=1 Tax=Natrialba asiatica (strain ATCC 700177 / DSM 12278 / JCM 9576 / FERM P-10747 / NBRC 102637 / 172P1) TaxID=29540 RepID=M0B408_NATA1|nr:dihydrofolate reductase family protein [Natrialba asiatica]ELZ05277.1 bifunctional deaminase-reductase domain-containing protein [Natrialba asiatica DSM 12278]
MTEVFVDMSMSLDGFIAGPNDGRENPLGEGGERLHEWVFDLASWREQQGLDGGTTNRDAEIVAESIERTGTHVMGRRMFDNDDGPWGDEPFEGHWGETPPFHGPVFVLTHHPREPLEMDGGTTFHFVTDGIETALERARTAAGDGDVRISGGADVVRQYVEAGLVDEIQIQLVPVLLGDGIRLFEHLDTEPIELERTRVVDSPDITHLRYSIVD